MGHRTHSRIVAEGLTKVFGSVRAVDDLSFSAEPGVVTGFLGPNGAGKSTALRMVLGLVKPDAGRSSIGGCRYAELPNPSGVVGAVLDAGMFHPARSGRGHLAVYCTINGFPRRRADEVLDLVGLSEAGRRAVGGYSLGMRQRLALAAALLGDPGVLVLDEPANGLDPEGIVWMRELLRQFADEGRTVLVSSHVLSEMQQLVDHVVIINHGHLVRQATLAELNKASERVHVTTPAPTTLSRELESAGAHVTRTSDNTLCVTGMAEAAVGHQAFLAGVELNHLATARGDLEQVFLNLTNGASLPESNLVEVS